MGLKRKAFWVGAATLMGLGVWWMAASKDGEILNPLDGWRREEAKKWGDRKVIGFLPPWFLGKIRDYCDEVSHLVFLGVEVDGEGNLVWETNGKKIGSEEYQKVKERIKKCGGKNIAGFKLFEDDKLDELFGGEGNLANLKKQIAAVVEEGRFDGVNIDFEYQSDPTKIVNQGFIDWLAGLKRDGLGEVEVDVFVNTINKSSKENLDKLLAAVDSVVVMAYDFHRPGVDFAGAVAPIGAEKGKRSIGEMVGRINELGLDKRKIVLAFPLYGYEWKTVGEELGAKIVRGWYQTASYRRVGEIIEGKAGEYVDLKLNWDDLSMSPWLSYQEDGQVYQIYYEDVKSIGAKMDLAKTAEVGGVGFWALGYEGKGGEVWKVVEERWGGFAN